MVINGDDDDNNYGNNDQFGIRSKKTASKARPGQANARQLNYNLIAIHFLQLNKKNKIKSKLRIKGLHNNTNTVELPHKT